MAVTSSKGDFVLPFPSGINQGTAIPCHTCGSSYISGVITASERNGYVPNSIRTVALALVNFIVVKRDKHSGCVA